MSTSPSLAPEKGGMIAFQPFRYETVPAVAPMGGVESGESRNLGSVKATSDLNAREDRARAEGVKEGNAQAGKIFQDQLASERASIAGALSQFTRDRAAYFQKIEGEVVQLALSIARKILHREAQIDPLLLAGIVRVALEKIDGATGVVLHVHPQNVSDWRRYLEIQLDPADIPEIKEDPSQRPDTRTLETAMGTAELGVEVQLKEIEQGLMDLLGARPGTSS